MIGWRSWGLRRRGPDLELTAVIDGHGAWPAREPLVAACRPHARPTGASEHESPYDSCVCGVYASDTLRSLALSGGSFPARCPSSGPSRMWGRVIVHERGFRARFAYPDRLRLVCAQCVQRGDGAGIPTKVIEQRTAPGGTGTVRAALRRAPRDPAYGDHPGT